MYIDVCERAVDLVIKVDEKYEVFNRINNMKNKNNLRKDMNELNNDIGNIIYNELLGRFYKDKEIKEIIPKYKVHKKDLGLLLFGPGRVILGYKVIKVFLDNNLDIDEYYKKFIHVCDNQGLRDKLSDNDNYVPNDDELINLMKVYKRKTNIDLIEILHCKHGHLNIKYR